MNIRIQILIVVITLLAMFYVINKIRNKGIELKYSLVWLALGTGIIIFTCFPKLTTWLAHVLGISQPMNMLFFAGFCFMLPIIFSLSVSGVQAVKQGEETDTGDGAAGGAEKKSRRRE